MQGWSRRPPASRSLPEREIMIEVMHEKDVYLDDFQQRIASGGPAPLRDGHYVGLLTHLAPAQQARRDSYVSRLEIGPSSQTKKSRTFPMWGYRASRYCARVPNTPWPGDGNKEKGELRWQHERCS